MAISSKTFKRLILSASFIALALSNSADARETTKIHNPESIPAINHYRSLNAPFDGTSFAGNYLSGLFAQRHHDWARASRFFDQVRHYAPRDPQLLRRIMVLSMGSGHYDQAISLAENMSELGANGTLNMLFLTAEAFHQKDYPRALSLIDDMPRTELANFILPPLRAWAMAAQGEHKTNDLNRNTLHIYHAILISDYLGQTEHIRELAEKAEGRGSLSLDELERIADIYGHIGEKGRALAYYKKIAQNWPENHALQEKIAALEEDRAKPLFHPVPSPEHGVAEAFYDMARMLYRDDSDESARVFANLALYLNPALADAKLLMAAIETENERYHEAIGYYERIQPGHADYLEANRRIASLYEDSARYEEAIHQLEMLAMQYKDHEALIQIGDIHRRQKNFESALSAYDLAAERLGQTIPAEYWHLHYVRGMAHEQSGDWTKAEADLKAALLFQPDHPYVLNYLGYGWADRNENLGEALQYIRKAVSLRPQDGYITDSLGWVYYRMGLFEQAVPYLERAVELLPYDPVINDHLGDAYWQVGRKLEAEFQWTRAKNHSKDASLIKDIGHKLVHGLETIQRVQEAKSQSSNAENLKP